MTKGSKQFLSSCVCPVKYATLIEQFNRETPDCPWNEDAAETLAKPPEHRGWQQCYVDARENWKNWKKL